MIRFKNFMGKLNNPLILLVTLFVLMSIYLLFQSLKLSSKAAMLPTAMLISIIGLSSIMIVRELFIHKKTKFIIFSSRYRFIVASIMIFFYVLSIDFIGFYTSTTIMIPFAAYFFGYRNLKGLLIATSIFMVGIALIFYVLMSQDFPSEFFLR